MDKLMRKNILDLYFQKSLIVASTSVIVFFTYLVGLVLGFLTNQIKFDTLIITVLFLFSAAILGSCAFFFFKALEQIRIIPQMLKTIK